MTSRWALRDGAATGSADDAALLAAVPLEDFYAGDTDAERVAAVADLLRDRGVSDRDRGVGELLHEALGSHGPMNLLVNETMQKAQPVSELGKVDLPWRRCADLPTGP